MSTSAINFPGLGISLDPSRTAFTFFGHDVQWYGVIIAVGFLLAVIYGLKNCERFGFSKDDIIDFLFVALPAGIIGARLYFVLFYHDPANPGYNPYFADPISILYIWNGGLGFYGGLIGGMLGAIIVAFFKKVKPLAIADIGSIGFLLAYSIGRWGNFINREAFGAPTDVLWRMQLNIGGKWTTAHPCFFYESIWNLIGFGVIHLLSKKRKFDGETLLMYLAWYGAGRMITEGLRTDSLYISGTNLRVSQFIAILTFVIALALLIILRFRQHDPKNMQVERYAKKLARLAIEKAAADLPVTADVTTDKVSDTRAAENIPQAAETAAEVDPAVADDVPTENLDEATETDDTFMEAETAENE